MIRFDVRDDFSAAKAAVLGSTGSVGRQTMEILGERDICVDLLSAGGNMQILAEQVERFRPRIVSVKNGECAEKLRSILSDRSVRIPAIIFGEKETSEAIMDTEADIIFHSVSGMAGISQAIAASRTGKRIGMANKESIISLGEVLFENIEASGGELIPVDSEHSAVFRCMYGNTRNGVRKIVLTASGGPFRGHTAEELSRVTLEDTLRHPTWKMGRKITIDSATLMNKGFEIIEAVKLFGFTEDRIDVVIHPQSIVHSMIAFEDGTMLAQMGRPDMRDCIRYALTAPRAVDTWAEPLDLAEIGRLDFSRPDTSVFRALDIARAAVRKGGTCPASLITADEIAVESFEKGLIGFSDIIPAVESVLEKVPVFRDITYESVMEAFEATKKIAEEQIKKTARREQA